MGIAPVGPAPFPLEAGGTSSPQAFRPVSPDGGQVEKVSFADVFGQMVVSANQQSQVAEQAAVMLAEGRSDDIHGTMIEGQKAAIQTKLVGQVKNKVVDAFYELWRMNI